jgi:predicted O-methyltransferase YrrM
MTPAQRWLADRISEVPGAKGSLLSHAELAFLSLLACSGRAGLMVVVGTGTGCTSLALALGAPMTSSVHTWDANEEWKPLALEAWRRAGAEGRIRQYSIVDSRDESPRPGTGRTCDPASWVPEEVQRLRPADLAVIDATRVSYQEYWEVVVSLVKWGGVIVVRTSSAGGNSDAARITDVLCHAQADRRIRIIESPCAENMVVAWKSRG